MQPNSTCGMSKYYISSSVCEDSVIGNSTLETLSGEHTQAMIELISFTNFSVTSEDKNNNIMCQSFSENIRIQIVFLHSIVSPISLQN